MTLIAAISPKVETKKTIQTYIKRLIIVKNVISVGC